MDIDIEELLQLQFLEAVNNDEVEDSIDVDVWSVENDEAENDDEAEYSVHLYGVSNLHSKKKKNLTKEEKKLIILDLFLSSTPKLLLPKGMINETALKYGVSRWSIHRVWKEAKRQRMAGEDVIVTTKRQNCGRKAIFVDEEALRVVPLKQRTTIRSFANALEVSPSTVHRLIQKGFIRSHSNSIKPKLTEKHKRDRLNWILRFVVPPTVREKPRFDKLYNIIHIDEKWFFMSKATQRFYLLSEEEDPYRSCQSKAFITKVMFMAALARPWLGDNGEIIWDGKIEIFPFIEEVEARRTSINRPKGTIETKPLQHITKDIIRHMILEVILPKIREVWPNGACKTIWIQQDNARPHIQADDRAFVEVATIDGFQMCLIQQPAQSPDLNILDLGFFRAIQSIQHQTFPDTVEKLITSVKDAYDAYDPKAINYTWLQLMYVMAEIMKVKGGNNYKSPHVGKKSLERQGELPKHVDFEPELLTEIFNHLNSNIVFEDGSENIDRVITQ